MKRHQYRTIIIVLSILNISLLIACFLLISRVSELSSDTSLDSTSIMETIPNKQDSIDTAEQGASSNEKQNDSSDINSTFTALAGTWVDDSNTLTIQNDGSFVWLMVAENSIWLYEQGYLSNGNNMIITCKYEAYGIDAKYKSISEIPDSELDKNKQVGYTIIQTSSETLSMQNVRGETLGYAFVKE